MLDIGGQVAYSVDMTNNERRLSCQLPGCNDFAFAVTASGLLICAECAEASMPRPRRWPTFWEEIKDIIFRPAFELSKESLDELPASMRG